MFRMGEALLASVIGVVLIVLSFKLREVGQTVTPSARRGWAPTKAQRWVLLIMGIVFLLYAADHFWPSPR
jgi:hypothetical protein